MALKMTEKQLQAAVTEAAALGGWLSYHTFDSRKSQPGFPDLVLVHPRRGVLYAELKTDTGRMTDPHRKWMNALSEAGAAWRLIRPADSAAVVQWLVYPPPMLEHAERAPGATADQTRGGTPAQAR